MSLSKHRLLSACILELETNNEPSLSLKFYFFKIIEKALTWAISWLKTSTMAFTFKNLLRHYAEWLLIHGE